MPQSKVQPLITAYEPPDEMWVWHNVHYIGYTGEYQAWNWKVDGKTIIATLYFTTDVECRRVCEGVEGKPIHITMTELLEYVRRPHITGPQNLDVTAIALGDGLISLDEMVMRHIRIGSQEGTIPKHWMWVK